MPAFRPADLAFDTGAAMATLKRWVACESPSYDGDAVNRMAGLAAGELAAIGGVVQRIPGQGGFGDCIIARFGEGEGGILVMGHLDTVHPVGTLKELPWREEKGLCFGPGILDMKGGIVIALHAIAALKRAGLAPDLPVTFLLNSDEEVGSPSTRALVEQEAARHRYVLIPEPARRDGAVVVGRHAVSRFKLKTRGKASHAGLRLNEGRSAIQEMAHQIIAIDRLSAPDCTFSAGVVRGGQWVNCVARECEAELLSVSTSEAARAKGLKTLSDLRPTAPGAEIEIVPGPVRPFWHKSPRDQARSTSQAGLHLSWALILRVKNPAAVPTAISPAPWACPRWTGLARAATRSTPSTNISWSKAWPSVENSWPAF